MRATVQDAMREHLRENPTARSGFLLLRSSMLLLLALRLAFTVFEAIYFIIAGTPINLFGTAFLLPFLLIIYIIYNGQKLFGYFLLGGSVIRLIFFYATVYEKLPAAPLREVYSVTLFAVLIIQFILSLLYIFNSRCDSYFIAYHRINLRVSGEYYLKK